MPKTQHLGRDLNVELFDIVFQFVTEIADLPLEPKKSHAFFVGQAMLAVDAVAKHRRSWDNMLNKQFGGTHVDTLRGIPKL